MELKLTQNPYFFQKMNVPTCKLQYITDSLLFPKALEFGKVYYKVENNQLVAFKIAMYAVYSKLTTYNKVGISYLVETPGQDAVWVNDFITPDTIVYESKESFVQYQFNGRNNVDLVWKIGRCVFPTLARAAVIGLYGYAWAWDKNTNKPANFFYPNFHHFVVTADEVIGYIPQKNGIYDEVYLTKEECVKTRLEGIEIVEFGDPAIEVNIKFTPTTKVVHTLRFIEE